MNGRQFCTVSLCLSILCLSRCLSLCACPLLCLSVSVSTHAPQTVPASVVATDSSQTCPAAQHITCTHTITHAQLHTAPLRAWREKRRAWTAFLRSDRGAPTQHATTPAASTELPPLTRLRAVGGGESHRSRAPCQFAANLADPAELRDTNHEARRLVSAPVLVTGA